jgi:hypothetical protein
MPSSTAEPSPRLGAAELVALAWSPDAPIALSYFPYNLQPL